METTYFKELQLEVENVWWTMATRFDNFENKYHKDKDLALKDLHDLLIKDFPEMNNGFEDEALLNHIKNFAIETLDIKRTSVEVLFNEDYFKFSQAFITRAKQLDHTLSMASIFQGLRNVWTMHSMQLYLNKPLELTDSVFAYSMLYPLTDNLLDSPLFSKSEKLDFNKRFKNKISTGLAEEKSDQEKQIFHMIDLIQGEWDRKLFPKVYDALLSILEGQNLSLHQQNLKSIYDHDILGISIYKGGASVLADAYLIGGHLSQSEEKFAFYYGVVLQLADDLQDIKEDLKSKHYTIMNIQSKFASLDGLFQKYLNFIDYFSNEIYSHETENQKALSELTRESIQLLIFAAVLKNKKLFSKALYQKVKLASNFSKKAYKKSEKLFYKRLKTIKESRKD